MKGGWREAGQGLGSAGRGKRKTVKTEAGKGNKVGDRGKEEVRRGEHWGASGSRGGLARSTGPEC